MTRVSNSRDEIYVSVIPTAHLLGLALTVPTVDGKNELFGRSHAWYSIASTQVAAIEFILAQDDPLKVRHYAAEALARAGYDLADIDTEA